MFLKIAHNPTDIGCGATISGLKNYWKDSKNRVEFVARIGEIADARRVNSLSI